MKTKVIVGTVREIASRAGLSVGYTKQTVVHRYYLPLGRLGTCWGNPTLWMLNGEVYAIVASYRNTVLEQTFVREYTDPSWELEFVASGHGVRAIYANGHEVINAVVYDRKLWRFNDEI